MSDLLDADAWLDEQLAATKPPVVSNKEMTFDELDAMAAAELPVQDAPIPPNTPTAPAAASGAPEQTGSPDLITGEGELPSSEDSRMDAEAWLDNAIATTPTPRAVKLPNGRSSYGNDFLKTIDTTKLTPEEYLSIEPDVEVVKGMLHNPQYTPSFEEWQDLTAVEKRLIDEGKIKKPGNLEMIGNAVGGLVVLASDFIYNTAIDADGSITRPGETIDRMQQGTWRLAPAETLARSPATMVSAGKLAGATLQYLGQMIDADWNERPEYVVNETGEFLASSSQLRLPPSDVLAKDYAARGQTIRPVNEQELQQFDYDRFVQRRQTQKLEDDALNNTTAPTEFVTMLLTGRNQAEKPIQSQAQVASIGADPTALVPFASAGTRWGLSAFGKNASAKMLSGLEKASGGIVRANDALLDRFAKTVSDQTGVELSTWQKGIQTTKDLAKGSVAPMLAGSGANMAGVDPATSAAIGGSYLLYKGGLGVLRRIETGSRAGKTILRESADATNGLDQVARLAVAANPAVPTAVREVLERPSNFIPLESTPARIASNPAFGPTTRAVADRLSNPLVVQAVRNTAALAKGSAKGAIANAPFAYMSANAGDEEGAAAAIGSGLAFGAGGAAFERVAGVRDRRYRQAVSDIGRMLVDVELVGGDVNHLVKTRDMQGLADLAALQGYYRNGFDFVPLNNADYNDNRLVNGQKDMVSPNKKGTAGYFVQIVPDGGKPIIYMNLDATNRNPLPHEIGHLITAGGLDNPQKVAARAWVDKTYGEDGIKARGEEYARTLIQARAAAAARAEGRDPQPIDITPDMLAAEMESLGQDGLVRGDLDTMDWARDEIFAETFATNAETMDWSSIRRGNPAGGNFLTFAEGILGAQARGLMAAGVRIDPQTGKPLDTPARLFNENPVLAADPQVMKQLETYSKNWKNYTLAPEQSKPRGARIAPSGRVQDIANTGLVKNHANDQGGQENLFQVTDPAGNTRSKEQSELNAEQKLRSEQVGNLFKTKKLNSPADPTVSLKKRTDGRVEIFGRRLPQNFFFSNSFGRHIRDFARVFEEAMDSGETLNTSYFALLTRSDTGAVRVKDLGNTARIDREVVPFQWFVSKQNNILAEVLDVTKFRNRFNRAVADADEPIARLFDNKWDNIEPTFKKLLDNHRNNLPGESGLGGNAVEKKDVLNALIGIATNENRSRNPYNGRYGSGSAIERFRLDRINDSTKSGRTGYQFDYQKAAGNALPEIPTPLPDLSKDLPTPKGQAMPDVTITPDEAKRQGLVGPVYHGSPDFKGQKFDLKYRARNSGLSRGGFSFTDNVESAKGYASNQIDSAQSAVDTANDVMRELAGRMDNGLKVDGFADSAELPEFNSRYVDDIESLGSYFDEIADKIPNDLGDRLRAAASKTNEPANPVVVEAFLRNPKVTEINGKKLWLTENPDDIFVSGTTRPTPGQAMPNAASKRQEIIKSSLPYYLERHDPEFAQGMVIYDMMETISLPNGWSLEDRIPSKYGSAYWKITDRLGGNWKLTLRDHPFSPAREKEFGVSDLYSIVEDARNPEQFNSGMSELEGKLLAADRELESITASQNTIAKTAPSLADKITELRQTLARKEDFFNRGIRIGNGKPFTTDNQRQSALDSINQTKAELNEALKKENQSGENLKGAVRSSGPQSVSTSETGNDLLPASGLMSTPGQAMLDSVPDKGIDMPAGSMTQLYTVAAKSLPKTIPQAKSVPIVRVMVREKLFDAEGKPVLDKKGKQKEGMTPKLRDNTEIKFKPGNFDLPLPNYQLAKSKFSIGNKDFIGEAVKNRDKVVAAIEQVNKATEVITNDPFKFTDPKGYAEIMRDAGVTKNILVPPSGIDMMLKRPKDFIALLDGGFHGPRTVQGTKAAAMAGLDGVVEMRQVIGEKPTEFVTALHHLWGTLSKQLPPLDQEALWMRLVVQPEVIQQIQNSIDGTFKLKKEQWKSIVDKARVATKGEYGKLGNNATSNANSFFLMLKNHNGRWNEVANLYATDSAIDMRSKFNGLGHGATGIKNKVQGFIGLTFGIKGTVLDRWRFVDLYMDPVMQATGAPTHQHYFQYTGDAKRIPEDPIGIYANYGTIENENPAFSLALYNGIDRAAQTAINASPELKAYLGNHADPGGLHWVTWNAIKNEAVGHSSLDLTKNFLKQFGREGTAQDWLNFANSSKAYVEGQAANGREIIRLSLDNGVFNYSRQ